MASLQDVQESMLEAIKHVADTIPASTLSIPVAAETLKHLAEAYAWLIQPGQPH